MSRPIVRTIKERNDLNDCWSTFFEKEKAIINIQNDYLKTLEPGEHSLTVYLNDGGVAKAEFAIEVNESDITF